MKMRRLLALVVMATAIVLAGCNQQNSPGAPGASQPAASQGRGDY